MEDLFDKEIKARAQKIIDAASSTAKPINATLDAVFKDISSRDIQRIKLQLKGLDANIFKRLEKDLNGYLAKADKREEIEASKALGDIEQYFDEIQGSKNTNQRGKRSAVKFEQTPLTPKPVSELKTPEEFKDNLAVILSSLEGEEQKPKHATLLMYREELREAVKTLGKNQPDRAKVLDDAIKDLRPEIEKAESQQAQQPISNRMGKL